MCLIPGPYLGEIASVKQVGAQYEKRPNRDIKKFFSKIMKYLVRFNFINAIEVLRKIKLPYGKESFYKQNSAQEDS